MARARRQFTTEERTQIVDAYSSGDSLRVIAQKFNTSHSAVERIINGAGIMRDRRVYPKKSAKGLLGWVNS